MDEILRQAQPTVGTAIADKIRAEVPTEGFCTKARRVLAAVRSGAIALKRTSCALRHKIDNAATGRKLMDCPMLCDEEGRYSFDYAAIENALNNP